MRHAPSTGRGIAAEFRRGALAAVTAVVIAAASVSSAAGLAYADDREAKIAEAVAAYADAQQQSDHRARVARFRRAAQLFEAVIDRGAANAELLTNAGTASLQAERIGPAVLAFRRALAIDPDHARALQNLAHARTLLPPWVPRPTGGGVLDSFFFWHRSLSIDERAIAAALLFLIAAAAAAHGIRWSTPAGRIARGFALIPALVWIALVASMISESDRGAGEAVIVADETVARAADSANAPSRFAEPLPGGVEVRAIEVREHWVRVELANGRDAWVNRGSVALL